MNKKAKFREIILCKVGVHKLEVERNLVDDSESPDHYLLYKCSRCSYTSQPVKLRLVKIDRIVLDTYYQEVFFTKSLDGRQKRVFNKKDALLFQEFSIGDIVLIVYINPTESYPFNLLSVEKVAYDPWEKINECH